MCRVALLVLAAAMVGACSRADEATSTGSRSGSQSAPASANQGNVATARLSAPVGFYAAAASSSYFPTPDTGSDGRFDVENGCLIFVSSQGIRYLPVFPLGTKLQAVSKKSWVAAVHGRQIFVGRQYNVKGGESQYSLDPRPPAACPNKQFLVGAVS